MPPKQKKGQKMDLNAFLADENTGGSWADEMDALPSGPSAAPPGEGGVGLGGSHLTRNLGARGGPGGGEGFGAQSRYGDDRPQRVEVPFPTAAPYNSFVGNLSFETTEQDVAQFFDGLGVKSIRLVAGMDGKPRGFGYVEFETADDLRNALSASGSDLAGRTVRISVAEAKEGREGRADAASSWERSGPLAPLPGRSGGFGAPRTGGFGDRDAGAEVERDGPLRGGKFVPSAPAPQRSFSGAGGAPPRGGEQGPGFSSYERAGRMMAPEPEVEREGPIRGGKFVASEPPREQRRMFSDREPSRADEGNWERRGPQAGGAPEGRRQYGSGFAGAGGADAPTRRPLNLAARTTSSAESTPSSSPAPSSKASPFGAARPVDNAARDREVEEKLVKQREEAAKEKEAKIAAAKAAAEAAPKVETAAGKEGAGAKKNVQEPSRSEGAWERRGPLPEKEKREHRQAGAGKLPPPVPTVATASKDAPPHQPAAAKKEQGNFSFANSAAALEEATL